MLLISSCPMEERVVLKAYIQKAVPDRVLDPESLAHMHYGRVETMLVTKRAR